QRRHASGRRARLLRSRQRRAIADAFGHEPAPALGPRLPPRAQARPHDRRPGRLRDHPARSVGRGATVPAQAPELVRKSPQERRSSQMTSKGSSQATVALLFADLVGAGLPYGCGVPAPGAATIPSARATTASPTQSTTTQVVAAAAGGYHTCV